jgi:hypothetical protein
MSADFKLCIKCDKLVNILDDHDCYRHRVCNSEFPCEICKSWTSEKRQSVERMIDKARLAATKKHSQDRLMLRLVLQLQVLLRGHDNLLLQAFLRGPTTKTIKVFLRGQ